MCVFWDMFKVHSPPLHVGNGVMFCFLHPHPRVFGGVNSALGGSFCSRNSHFGWHWRWVGLTSLEEWELLTNVSLLQRKVFLASIGLTERLQVHPSLICCTCSFDGVSNFSSWHRDCGRRAMSSAGQGHLLEHRAELLTTIRASRDKYGSEWCQWHCAV